MRARPLAGRSPMRGFQAIARVFVVVPVFNRLHFTKECVAGLREQTYPAVTIIVVDHGSSDGTADYMRRVFPDVVLVSGRETLWWTGAINLGVAAALERCGPGDYVLLHEQRYGGREGVHCDSRARGQAQLAGHHWLDRSGCA